MGADTALRMILLVECCLALIGYGFFIGALIDKTLWLHRIVMGGVFVVLTYVVAGQVKALQLSIQFDGYAWLGLAAYTVLNVGLAWFLWERRPEHRG